MSHPFLGKLKRDIVFRIRLFLSLSLVFNFAYAVFLFSVSRIYMSKWFFVTSAYYGLLCAVRALAFAQFNPQKPLYKKAFAVRAIGYILLLLNATIFTMLFILIYTTPPVKHHEITVIALATYTFSAFALAITGEVKHFNSENPALPCVKTIGLISAGVSMVTLTNTMLATFGQEDLPLRSILLPILCGVASVFILVCTLLLIGKMNSILRILKDEQERK